MAKNTTARHYCFTSFASDAPLFDDTKMRYMVYQKEHTTAGKTHWQGYVELTNSLRPTTLAKLLGNAHVEYRKGTRDEARDYCMKEESRCPLALPVEHGVWSNVQGKRNDLNDVYEMIREGKEESDILGCQPGAFIRYNRGIREAIFVQRGCKFKRLRRTNLVVELFYGESGSGKTRHCYDTYGDSLFCLTKGNSKNCWFDGYQGETTLLLDDFYGWIAYGFLLNALDIYPFRVEVKGGHTWAQWTRVIITSNKPWNEWYRKPDQDALFRRIHQILHFTKDSGVTVEKEFEEEKSREEEKGSSE